MAVVFEHVDIIEPKTKKETIIKQLRDRGLLNYGCTIDIPVIEEMYDCRKKLCSEREWPFIVLNLMAIIESNGYFATTRGKEGSVYILEASEMAHENEKCNKRAYQQLHARQRALYMIDHSLLNEKEKKKLEFECLRNGSIEIQMSKELKMRCKY